MDGQPIWFDASRSTGVGLKYMIEFGDGQTSSESIIAHIPNVDPRRNNGGRLTVTDRWGRLDSATAQYPIFGFGFYGPYESWLASSTGQLNLARIDPIRHICLGAISGSRREEAMSTSTSMAPWGRTEASTW